MLNSRNMLPFFLLENPTFKELLSAEQLEFNELENYIKKVRDELYIYNADKLIPRYEKIFDIKARGTKEERIYRILSKLNFYGVFNVSYIKKLVKIIMSSDCEVIEHFDDYWVEIILKNSVDDELKRINVLREEIEELKPAHLYFSFILLLEIISFKNRNTVGLISIAFKVKNNNFGTYNNYLNGFKNLDGSFNLKRNLSKNIRINKLKISLTQFNVNDSHVYLSVDTMWNLNGFFNINGTKKINANIRREVL